MYYQVPEKSGIAGYNAVVVRNSVNWTFTSGGADVHTRLFVDHHVLSHMLNFAVGLSYKII